MPFVPELVGREVFCLGCGCHLKIPPLDTAHTASTPLKAIVLHSPSASQRDESEDDSTSPRSPE
jgi:hypothetical protein